MADRGPAQPGSGAMTAKFIKVLPVLIILVPLLIHFIFSCFVLLSGWLPATFLFSHVFFFLTGAWIVHNSKSIIPVIMYIAVVAVTILMDIIQLGLHFSDFEDVFGDGDTREARTWQFSAAMMILSLMMKPLTIALACVAAYLISGGPLPGLGQGQRDDYAEVDSHVPT